MSVEVQEERKNCGVANKKKVQRRKSIRLFAKVSKGPQLLNQGRAANTALNNDDFIMDRNSDLMLMRGTHLSKVLYWPSAQYVGSLSGYLCPLVHLISSTRYLTKY